MKKVLAVHSSPAPHWVGDGFPVRTLFSHSESAREISPFLLLDHAPPTVFAPAARPRGVGEHPHRGFETVTIVYQGEVEHRDSTGQGGIIGPGDVQWMTAASGILHEELHSHAFTRSGGTMEMVQLWVNLPAKDKTARPGYQTLLDRDIPRVSLPDGAGTLRVIAGSHAGHAGPARTFTPIDVWDVHLLEGRRTDLTLHEGRTTAVVVLRGTLLLNGEEVVRAGQAAFLDRAGTDVSLEADDDVALLVLSGEPIDEPVVGQGPFVMNTREEIAQAIRDYQSGRFGTMDR
jgi:redox-sensitive bicupin YhaK (pirin superfamily)